tara:strand:- start:6229 stop:6588 length:360 start_codon:yes stop_codon:yes gene_type:complete
MENVTFNQSKHIDWEACLKITNNNQENALKLVSMFIKDLPVSRGHINQAFTQRDAQALKTATHKLLGASCYCGAKTIQQVLEDIGKDIPSNNWDRIAASITQLNTTISQLMDYYRETVL